MVARCYLPSVPVHRTEDGLRRIHDVDIGPTTDEFAMLVISQNDQIARTALRAERVDVVSFTGVLDADAVQMDVRDRHQVVPAHPRDRFAEERRSVKPDEAHLHRFRQNERSFPCELLRDRFFVVRVVSERDRLGHVSDLEGFQLDDLVNDPHEGEKRYQRHGLSPVKDHRVLFFVPPV